MIPKCIAIDTANFLITGDKDLLILKSQFGDRSGVLDRRYW